MEAKIFAEVFRAAADGVMASYNPQQAAIAQQQGLQQGFSQNYSGNTFRRVSEDEISAQHTARQMAGVFNAIAAVFEKMAEAESR